ncbi:LysR family transcriptional regulator protein [Luteimonas sp. 9C]|uniref:LysR family transcriptional regulator n=1 Tax=Luteimonas sp. 9C TaxID=2653148 RepID=UPI0012F42188|nr:LysR family transcriptional regulator [Luteimonas sp. 9C]VXB65669.1 LysR family transcriptional regulator protein [Luteimonas sp. 9C]
MLNPQWLRTFAAVVSHRSFTRAAEALELTQAAVSQHIQRLEERLGRLLIRRPRQIELTPAGTALLTYWQDIQIADRRLAERLVDTDTHHGEVRLISPGSIGLALHPLLLALQLAHRGLVIRHRFAPDDEALDAVLHNRYELGLVTRKPDDPRIVAARFTEEALELVVPADASVARWQDLQQLGFIDHPDGDAMATRLLSRRFPGEPGLRGIPVHGFSNQISLILEPVALGLGFTVVPHHARRMFPRPEAIRVVEGADAIVDTLWWIHRAEWPLPARAAFVAAHLEQALQHADITATGSARA